MFVSLFCVQLSCLVVIDIIIVLALLVVVAVVVGDCRLGVVLNLIVKTIYIYVYIINFCLYIYIYICISLIYIHIYDMHVCVQIKWQCPAYIIVSWPNYVFF